MVEFVAVVDGVNHNFSIRLTDETVQADSTEMETVIEVSLSRILSEKLAQRPNLLIEAKVTIFSELNRALQLPVT